MAALVGGLSEINSHFTAPPFQYRELKEPGIRRVLSSYDVLEGPATGIIVWATRQFREANPRTMAAFVAALNEAMAIVNRDKRATAAMYIEATKSKFSVDDIFEIIADPQAEFSITPKLVMKQVDFLHRTGQLKTKPTAWQQLFIPELHGLPAS
jgi:NitT/TauT family transport system substrate-binding protein